MKNAKKWSWIILIVLIAVFGINYAAGNQLFNALWDIGKIFVVGGYRLLTAVSAKISGH